MVSIGDRDDAGEELCRDPEARDDLADGTIAHALVWFREHALVGGRWDPDGGASLSTYFMKACLYKFPNEMHRLRRTKQLRAHDDPPPVTDHEDRTAGPEATVVGNRWVRDCLERADARTRSILALKLDGYSYEEIVELLDEGSVRAVEGVVHRWRTRERHELKGGGPDGRP